MQYFSLQWQSNDSQLLHRSHTPLPPPRSHSHNLLTQTAAQRKKIKEKKEKAILHIATSRLNEEEIQNIL